MKIVIEYKKSCGDRPWLIKRVPGEYMQHAHMRTKKDAVKVRNLIKANRYPYSREYKFAMKRLLTEEEFKKLKKKQRYYNSQKGPRR